MYSPSIVSNLYKFLSSVEWRYFEEWLVTKQFTVVDINIHTMEVNGCRQMFS